MPGPRFALFVVAAACAFAQPVADPLTARALKADVSFLASDALEGRGTPSRGLDVAAEYIAAQFRRAGLETAGDDGYFQTASMVSVAPNTEGLELTVEVGGKTIKTDSAGLGVLSAAPLDLEKLQLYYAPADRPALDALTAGEVAGKVLVCGVGTPRLRSERLEQLRPALVLYLSQAAGPQRIARPRLVEAGHYGIPIFGVWDSGVRNALVDAKPGPMEGTVSVHEAAPRIMPVKLRNVVGVLRGSDPALKDTYVLVTAHYDHLGMLDSGEGDLIFNGANDDASGTASVIEIANALAAQPRRPRRSIVFMALFGEELGDLGSRYYAAHPIFPLAKTAADINLEQLGRTDDVEGPRVGLFNLTGFDFTDLAATLRGPAERMGVRVVKDEKNSDPFFARSDNSALAAAGVPSTTISVGYIFPDYHRTSDEWPKLDYENLAKVDHAIAAGIEAIADSSAEPQWNLSNPAVERFIKARAASR